MKKKHVLYIFDRYLKGYYLCYRYTNTHFRVSNLPRGNYKTLQDYLKCILLCYYHYHCAYGTI